MSAGTLSPGGSEHGLDLPDERGSLQSAWANAIGSSALLVSLTAAAWWISVPAFGADETTRVCLTVWAGLYALVSTGLAMVSDRGVVSVGVTVFVTEALALVTGHVAVGLGVVGATIVMLIFVSRLDWALYAAGQWRDHQGNHRGNDRGSDRGDRRS